MKLDHRSRRAGPQARRGRHVLAATAIVALAAATQALPPAAAAPPQGAGHAGSNGAGQLPPATLPAPTARPHGHVYGMVPAARNAGHNPHRPTPNELAGSSFSSTQNLIYHGGPVMHNSAAYAIYWGSAGSTTATYQNLIDTYFGDVATASGATNNVYSATVQYIPGSTGYRTAVGGTFLDTSTAIPDHCSNEYAYTGVTVQGCVTDADIQNEVLHAIAAMPGWTPSPTSEFFVFTPPNVGSCFDTYSGECSYTYYCAYHSNFPDPQAGNADTIYANQPYADSTAVGAPGACDSGEHPNGDWADATINLISHEHNESITDPDGNAWYDAWGNEDGDKCAWTFGNLSAGSPSAATGLAYNQIINNDHYYLQREWSNASASCVLGYVPPAPPTPLTFSQFTGSPGTAGQNVTITGSGFTGTTAVRFNGTPASFTVNSDTKITTVVPTTATSGPISVSTSSATVTSSSSFLIIPTIKSFSPTSAKAGSWVAIYGYNFAHGATVRFNGTLASSSYNSPTKLTAKVPSGATKGPISVTTSGGTATSTGSFTPLH